MNTEGSTKRREQLIIVRGGGDLASGTIHRLCRCGYPVLVLETAAPSAIRRQVAFSEAVYDGFAALEDIGCQRVENLSEAWKVMKQGKAALMIDEQCRVLQEVRPWALVDAILAKKNLGTHRDMADRTIALGPGFVAGRDVDLVIETKRGHDLGRIIESGSAFPNTGIPGEIAGYGKERVLHSPAEGVIHTLTDIGMRVEKDKLVAEVITADEKVPVKATLTGLLRGMIRDGYQVTKGFKIADIDPRDSEYKNCFTISDKARCIAGSVLEGLLYLENGRRNAVLDRGKSNLAGIQ
ncbi:MAG: selenium-dependent molybdenum cofactor biosynthesis protein YqeB [Lachnospiraceae bacterium]|nr:selenium-dependent molybdenum cofactor biosynthesis protein YqeB [Lachnospiraceae bacterium]